MSSESANVIANTVCAPVSTVASPAISLGGAPSSNSLTGIYGDNAGVSVGVLGANIATIDANGLTMASGKAISGITSSVLAVPLTGFVSGAGTVGAADTILQGVDKLAGNLQNRAVTANLLTGLAAGAATTILSTDTILQALAKLQAQIDALP